MIRSCLFIPANNPAMIQNADLFGADAVIFDLEDAVAVEEKTPPAPSCVNILKFSLRPPGFLFA